MIRPPAPPPLPPDKVSPGHVRRRRKRWSRPRSYRREFMAAHPGLREQLIADERRKLRAFVWTRAIIATALVALVLTTWVLLMRHR